MGTIGDRLREAREGLSMAKAAALVGISQQAWNLYEKNSSAPGAKLILRICQAFHVSSDWLLGIDTDSRRNVSVVGNNNAVGNGAKVSVRNVEPGESPQCSKCPYKKQVEKMKKLIGK